MELFEPSTNPANEAHWVEWGEHVLSASGAPGARRFDRWLQAGVTTVVTLQRVDEMPGWLPSACEERGLEWVHFPISGKRLEAPTDRENLARLIEWGARIARAPKPPRRVVVHCSAGLHRTGVALYLMWSAVGLAPDDVLARVRGARELTYEELTRAPRRGARLEDVARSVYEAWCRREEVEG